jgi:hypothetical protein
MRPAAAVVRMKSCRFIFPGNLDFSWPTSYAMAFSGMESICSLEAGKEDMPDNLLTISYLFLGVYAGLLYLLKITIS